jgi:hypothetical protein
MSSVTRFLRQIPTGLSFYTLIGAGGEQTSNILYKLVPTEGNYVGNYPPGVMDDITAVVLSGVGQQNYILRDMGKTIQADVSGSNPVETAFFRQMQLIVPASASPTFGVIGAPNVPATGAPYYTVYLPVPVTGRGFILPAGVSLFPIAGGQM